MRARRRSSGSSSRVRFLGSERGAAHQQWYRAIAEHYGALYDAKRDANAAAFLHGRFRRHAPVVDVLDVACGTLAIDIGLVNRGYRVVGRDLSRNMIRSARRNLRRAGLRADVARGDMRSLRLGREFDAVLCLGTAFNYLSSAGGVRRAMQTFRRHLRPGGLLVLDLTNFDAWIGNPKNARAEVDHTTPDGTRIAVFAFNEQNPAKTVHTARMITVVQKGNRIDFRFDEADLKVWRKEAIARALRSHGFRPVGWYGDLKGGARYIRGKSPRLIAIAVRR